MKRIWLAISLAVVVSIGLSSGIVLGQGGFDSWKSINMTGVGNSSLVIGRQGVGDSRFIVEWESNLPSVPLNFTATRVGTNSANLTWVMGVGANTTVIRGSSESYPESVTDGYLVYSGNGTSIRVDGLSLGFDRYYYRAWSWNSYGYSNDYAETWIGGDAMLAIFLVILALGVTGLSFWRRALILTMGASLSWLALGILLLVSPESLGLPTIGESWVEVLAYLFFVMTVGCILWYISGIGKTRVTMTDIQGRSWQMWSKPPEAEKPEPRAQTVKTGRKDRLRKLRG